MVLSQAFFSLLLQDETIACMPLCSQKICISLQNSSFSDTAKGTKTKQRCCLVLPDFMLQMKKEIDITVNLSFISNIFEMFRSFQNDISSTIVSK